MTFLIGRIRLAACSMNRYLNSSIPQAISVCCHSYTLSCCIDTYFYSAYYGFVVVVVHWFVCALVSWKLFISFLVSFFLLLLQFFTAHGYNWLSCVSSVNCNLLVCS